MVKMSDHETKLEMADEIASRSELTEEDADELSEKVKIEIGEHYEE